MERPTCRADHLLRSTDPHRLGLNPATAGADGQPMADLEAAGDRNWSTRAQTALDRSEDTASIMLDGSFTVRWASGSWSHLFGHDPVGSRIFDLLHAEDVPYTMAALLHHHDLDHLYASGADHAPSPRAEVRIRHADDRWVKCLSRITNHLDDREVGALMVHVELVADRSALPHAIDLVAGGAPVEQSLLAVLDHMAHDVVRHDHSAKAVVWFDGEGRRHVTTSESPEIASILFSADLPPLPRNPGRVTSFVVTDLEPGPARRCAEDSGLACLWRISIGDTDDQLGHLLYWSSDMVTPDLRPQSHLALGCDVIRLALRERRRAEDMHLNVVTDPLTGVFNRRGLHEAFVRLTSSTPTIGALFIEIDSFKALVETWGPAVGDQLLTEVAARLDGVCRTADVVARMGTDEFVILCANVEPGALSAILRRVETVFTEPVITEAGPLDVTGRVGFGSASRGRGPSDQLRDTEQALYAMKRRARAGV